MIGRPALLGLWLLVACGAEPPPANEVVAAIADDGMCREHGVLEALCTKCNPALIPVFQKKGDWCPEHDLPESICPICHPERGGKPALALDLAGDESPPDGIRVRLANVEAGLVAGLRTVAVERAPEQREIGAIATVRYDATRIARLNPRAEGVIKALHVDIGSRVEVGTVLAQIESAAVGESQVRIATAKARLALARKQVARLASLVAEGAASQRAVDEAQGDVREAEGEIAALVAQQALIGKTEGRTYGIESPVAGVVVTRTASIGAFVDHDDVLFEVVDTSVMWAEVEVPELDIGAVSTGLTVTFRSEALGDHELTGTIDYIAPEVDAHSRTVLVRAALDNAHGLLRANMFVRAELHSNAATTPALVVPRAAVQVAKLVSMVFVQVAPDVYEGRRVTLGRSLRDDRIEVRGRLVEGERVVDRGAFLLKTETLKDSIGAGCCADDGGK